MLKKSTLIIWFLLVCVIPAAWAAHWNVFMYMDTGGDLSDMAIKSFADMLRAQIKELLN